MLFSSLCDRFEVGLARSRRVLATLLAGALLCASADAQVRVNVMPGYPNAPKISPAERVIARPGKPVIVWGNANGGAATAVGATYTWTFGENANLAIQTDGSLSGTVTNARFIYEEVTFQLQNGSTLETVGATLLVDHGASGADSNYVEFVVIANTDPSSDTSLEQLQIDVNIAIEDGLRYLYLKQNTNNSWSSYQSYDCAATAFAVWAMENQGHLPTNDFDEDIYAEFVAKGLDYILTTKAVVMTGASAISAPRALASLGAIADTVSDMNGNGAVVELCPDNRSGYSSAIACSAIIASLAPDRVVQSGPLVGYTYREVVEDAIDWIGHTQNRGGDTTWSGRGGWDYDPANTLTRSDMSINSWMYVAMEGAESVYGIDVPDWIKQECEHALVNHMTNAVGSFEFGYSNNGCGNNPKMPCSCGPHGHATTSGGLSGLRLAETTGPLATPGAIISQQAPPINSIAAMRQNALTYLGTNWGVDGNSANCIGNRRNYYAMWTTARALRLTAQSLGLPEGDKVQLLNGGVSFDWETGEENGSGVIAESGAREGYFHWLVRTQNTTGVVTDRGGWSLSQYSYFVGPVMNTCLAVLVLTPRVFLEPCPTLVVIPIVEPEPAANTSLPAGTIVTLSARALAPSPFEPTAAVFVNGQPVDSLDASGKFFKTVQIQEGPNAFVIDAINKCGQDSTTIVIDGVAGPTSPFDNIADVTTLVAIQYQNTTYNPSQQALIVEGRACNTYSQTLFGPVLMVFDNIASQGATLQNPDGTLPDGRPYVAFLGVNDALGAGQCSPPRKLIFHNPGQVPIQFSHSWMATYNSAPLFTTAPVADATPGQEYRYEAKASDAQQQPLVFSIGVGPDAMAIDALTGVVTWTPTMADLGSHQVELVVDDGLGGTGRQKYVLSVNAAPKNGVPFFTSAPLTHIAVGAAYHAQASASDPDGDPLLFSKTAGPADLMVAANGAVDWSFALPGDHAIGVRVSDSDGAFADQAFVLSVGNQPTNPHAPTLLGNPQDIAVIDALYIYQPVASDPDFGDVLTFSLPVAPTGMAIDALTGRVTWTPGSSQVGDQAVVLSVSDGHGGIASQAWTIGVVVEGPNLPPVILSTPNLIALVGEPYGYQAQAIDADDDDITWSLVVGPNGMNIDPASGLISWMPQTAGPALVGIRATDSHGGFGSQVFGLEVQPPNNPPGIVSTPITTAIVGGQYHYKVAALDPDDHPLTWSLETAPSGMVINPQTGVVAWSPLLADLGPHAVAVKVIDAYGGSASQPFTLDVVADTTAPNVQISVSQQPAFLEQPLLVCVEASDDVGVVSRTLSLGGQSLALNSIGCASLVPTTLTPLAFLATASDPAGNVTMAMASVNVVDPNDVNAPVLSIVSPAPGADITGPIAIVANIDDDPPGSLTWQVRVTRVGDPASTQVIASGSGTVTGQPIAQFDPTLLPNDSYLVSISASDGIHVSSIDIPYGVSGAYKLGQFEIAYTDLTLPLAGIPITITRQYTSLDTKSMDFGHGWRLALAGQVTDTPTEGGGGFPEPFNAASKVYVTRSDGKRVGFTFQPTPGPFPFTFLMTPRYVPDPGVFDTLAAVGDDFVIYSGGSYFKLFEPYNPRQYRFTTQEQVEYLIDEVDGLQLVTDIEGNTITVTDDGLFSSKGVAVLFERDSADRITKITEPVDPTLGNPPGAVLYFYDAAGNLRVVRDPMDAETSYFYTDPNFPHYLTDIVDPLGRPVVKNVFNADGRLIATCDSMGDVTTLKGCLQYDYAVAGVQTVFDALGNRTDLIVDKQGLVVIERHFKTDGSFDDTLYDHDADGNLLRIERPTGVVTSFSYDADGHLLNRTDPDGRTWSFTYDECGRIATETDPSANTISYTYDGECRLRFTTDAFGGQLELRYDAAGEVSDLIDAQGNTWHFTYDAYGNPATTTDPLGHVEQMQSSVFGELLTHIDRNGRRTDFVYDACHRPVQEIWDTLPPRVTTYTYDAAGFMTGIVDPDSSLAFTFWNTGLLKTVDNSGTPDVPPVVITYGRLVGSKLEPGYDGNGRLTHVMDSLGGLTRYSYDELGRLAQVQQGPADRNSSVRVKELAIEYDTFGLLKTVRRFADARRTPVANTSYEYACDGCVNRLSAMRHRRASDDAVLHDLIYTRDMNSNVLSLSDAEGPHGYFYDGLQRLLQVMHPAAGSQPDEQYSYDGNGNRSSSHLSANYLYGYAQGQGGNQLVQDDSYDYTYDLAGGLLRRTDRLTGAYDQFTYDHRGRVTQISHHAQNGAKQHGVVNVYDGLDRRIRSVVDGIGVNFIYDFENPILKLDDRGVVLSRRMYGLVIDDALAEEVAGQTRWFLTDEVGTLRDLISDTATVLLHRVYDSFGRLLGSSGSATDNDLTFTAREAIAGFDFDHFRARTYDPGTGRFLQEDPYAPFSYDYAWGNPLSYFDPLGTQPLIEYRPLLPGTLNWIYVGCEVGKVVYIGITKDFGSRARQHAAAARTFKICKFGAAGTRADARVLEQALIDSHGGPGGGQLQNRINSIAPSRPLYGRAAAIAGRLGGALQLQAILICLFC